MVLRFLMLALCGCILTGCGDGYVMRGKVLPGYQTAAHVVSSEDPRFETEGTPGVQIYVVRDHNSLRRARVAQGTSGRDGVFEFRISEFGAGWMDETWLIQIHGQGVVTGESIIRLPDGGDGETLLVTVESGQSSPIQEREDLLKQIDTYK